MDNSTIKLISKIPKKTSNSPDALLKQSLNQAKSKQINVQGCGYEFQVYNSKECAIKSYKDLIPDIINKEFKKESKHHIDFYLENKKYLIYNESSSDILPEDMKTTYSDFSLYVGALKHLVTLYKNIDSKIQVDKYEHSKDALYVVKKNWHCYKGNDNNKLILEEIEDFIRNKYNEFGLLEIVSACPYSVKPIQFNIIHLPVIKIIVTELLMTYGGESISYLFKKYSSDEIYNIIHQIAKGLNYFESYKIEHNDIKHQNILVDKILEIPIIRFIDLDVGKNISSTCKFSQVSDIRGYSDIYCAPEIYKAELKKKVKDLETTSSMCQVYSMGVLVLFLDGYFYEGNNILTQFDKLKESESLYEKFYFEFQKYVLKNSDPLRKNILKIAEICLSYNPLNRLTANELLDILPLLNSKNANQIMESYKSIISNREIVNLNMNNEVPLNDNSKLENLNLNLNHISNEGAINTILNDEPLQLVGQMKIDKNKTFLNKDKEGFIKEINLLKEELVKKRKIRKDLENNLKEKESDLKNEKEKTKNFEQQILQKLMGKTNFESQIKNIENKITLLNEGNLIIEENKSKLEGKIDEIETHLNKISLKIEKRKNAEAELKKSMERFNLMKNRVNEENILLLPESSIQESIERLFEAILVLKRARRSKTSIYIENLQLSKNLFYTGSVKKGNIPNGFGMLHFPDSKLKIIAEFEKGIIKSKLNMQINENSIFFGKFEKTILVGPILTYLIPPLNQGSSPKDQKTIVPFLYEGSGKNTLKQGYFYEGQYKNNLKEGKGKIILSQGGYIEAEWIRDLREGTGMENFTNGCKYVGEYKNDKRNGKGKQEWTNGEFYEGEYVNNIIEGFGKYSDGKGNYYVGQWKSNKIEGKGKGKIDLPEGGYFEGEFFNGMKHGRGNICDSKGTLVEYDWSYNRKIESLIQIGKYCYDDGEYYEGRINNGSKEGLGKMVYFDGSYYEGEWTSNKQNGKGKYVWSNGDYYEGQFKNNVIEGMGKRKNSTGEYYDGEWINTKFYKGIVRKEFSKGELYEGGWSHGQRQGQGKYVYSNGDFYEGEWENSAREGYGKYCFVKQSKVIKIHEGNWENDKKEGEFKITTIHNNDKEEINVEFFNDQLKLNEC